MIIRVLGTGCPKCKKTYENVKKAVEELGIDAEIIKVENIDEISEWVMLTPGVVFDDVVVFEGKIPTVEDVKRGLKEYLEG
ncbi:hypothetical protein CFE53_06560 [Methanofervidicoccus sp. A16]|uniref:MTH895/ArsE family thioredoxin-like protein n=1 Tax=Methanofervidicoccus sp. A16 TaxID=2607662 RepID=UPI00118D2A17|nr:MTH895/ArsE family thioredoxin-like protein [Methanofervidicoccus sp. A16]AXI25798.1 hypothetical protein CFE53_06560 [Methanofervidicoccus sp. A16]